MLIRAEYFFQTMEIGQIYLGLLRPTLQKTILFGWVLTGKVGDSRISSAATKTSSSSFYCVTSLGKIKHQLQLFWQMENGGQPKRFSKTEMKCENHYAANHQRSPNVRFHELGGSRNLALERFSYLERKLNKDLD
jgi:hypothetical protein